MAAIQKYQIFTELEFPESDLTVIKSLLVYPVVTQYT